MANDVASGPDLGLIDTGLLERAIAAAHDDTLGDVVEELRAAGTLVVAAATAWIEAQPDHPMLAWSLLYVLDQAGIAEAVDLFARVAGQPIERTEGGGCHQVADLYELASIQASEALGRLAAAGDSAALEALFTVLSDQPSRAVRVAAGLAAYAASPDTLERIDGLMGEDADLLRWEPASAEMLALDDPGEQADTSERAAYRDAPVPDLDATVDESVVRDRETPTAIA